MTYIPASRTRKQLDLCLQSAVGPQFLGQWDMLRKSLSPHFFSLVPNSHMSKGSGAGGEIVQTLSNKYGVNVLYILRLDLVLWREIKKKIGFHCLHFRG